MALRRGLGQACEPHQPCGRRPQPGAEPRRQDRVLPERAQRRLVQRVEIPACHPEPGYRGDALHYQSCALPLDGRQRHLVLYLRRRDLHPARRRQCLAGEHFALPRRRRLDKTHRLHPWRHQRRRVARRQASGLCGAWRGVCDLGRVQYHQEDYQYPRGRERRVLGSRQPHVGLLERARRPLAALQGHHRPQGRSQLPQRHPRQGGAAHPQLYRPHPARVLARRQETGLC